MRTRIQNALQAIALAHGLRRGHSLWSIEGQEKIAFLPSAANNGTAFQAVANFRSTRAFS